MRSLKNNGGFTLLEIIIVVIIVGVLASLALPKFFSTVEFSRAQEGIAAAATIRGGLERYYVSKGNTYVSATTSNIDTGDPLAGQPNAHFTMTVSGTSASGYTITATRNTVDGGTATSNIRIAQTATVVTRAGSTAFAGIN